MGGCNVPGFFGMSSFVYDDADKYTMGDASLDAEGIASVEIGWVSGEVHVDYYSGDTVKISETANKKLDDTTTMYYLVDGDTLRVKFGKSGKFNFSRLEKELTVWLPEGMELDSLSVDATSADVEVGALTAREAVMDTVSGDISLEDTTLLESASFGTTSGQVKAKLGGAMKHLSVDTVSGDMELDVVAAEKLELDSTSGEVVVSVQEAPDVVSADTVSGDIGLSLRGAGEIKVSSTSGEVTVSVQEAPDAFSVDTVSGDVVLCLPKDAGFTVHWDSVSGSVDSELSMKKSGDDYVFGDGTKKYDVDTTSGDLRIEGR